MYTHLSNNKFTLLILLSSVSLFLFSVGAIAQKKWEGLGLNQNYSTSFTHLAVDTAEDKLVLGANALTHVNGASTCPVIKWTPENGVEILAPNDPSIMGVSWIQDIIFSHDSMIVVGANGMEVFTNQLWVYKVYDEQAAFYSIIPYKGKYLIATGPGKWFLGFLEPPRVIMWDGDTTFTEFENISDYVSTNAWVTALAIYKSDVVVAGNVRLSAGGIMDNIMKWDGTSWKDMDGGIHNGVNLGGVNVMKEYQGDLYIGGMFYQDNHSKENLIARWDGQNWKKVGGGFGWGYGAGSETIDCLHVHEGYLYASGQFQLAGGTPAHSIARWDGNEWCGCGSTFDGQILSMTHYRDTLYVGGGFHHIDGDSIMKVARFIGENFADTCGSLTTAIQGTLPEPVFLNGFPNPAKNNFTIQLPFMPSQNVKFVVYNNAGQVVMPSTYFSANSQINIEVGHFPSGNYVARIMAENKMYVVPFVKE